MEAVWGAVAWEVQGAAVTEVAATEGAWMEVAACRAAAEGRAAPVEPRVAWAEWVGIEVQGEAAGEAEAAWAPAKVAAAVHCTRGW